MLRPIEIGLLAEVGKGEVAAFRRPALAAIATGNEIVAVDQVPHAGQIRNSNGPMLAALARHAGAASWEPCVARDDSGHLRQAIARGLAADVLLLSGGVSAGVLDLVPSVLKDLGVRQVFHKVNLKPGKPLWFGYAQRDGSRTLVFGLPGNPVSSLVCFELFVRPAIQKMRGLLPTGLPRLRAKLTSDHEQRGERPTYWPSAVRENEVKPLPWKGSGDLRTLADANCLALFPAGDRLFQAGEEVEVRVFETPV
jgi:molybdopterin molybdotransferase